MNYERTYDMPVVVFFFKILFRWYSCIVLHYILLGGAFGLSRG